MNLSQITSKLSPKGWLMVGGAAAVTLLFFYLLISLASAPSYATLMAGVNPAQTGKITSALSAAGVNYQLQNNGTAVAVESGQQAQARVTLATAGLLNAGAQSNALNTSSGSSLGQSQFQQQQTATANEEQQLDNDIDQIQGVTSAEVQLAVPSQADQLFSVNQSTPSASVLIDDSGQLASGSVRGIANLVANAVTGLNSNKVTITDQNGQLLWPSSSGGVSGLLTKQYAENAYDTQMANQVDAMLATTLGAGKAVAQVNADLDANQTTLDSVTYNKKSAVPLTRTTSSEKLSGGDAGRDDERRRLLHRRQLGQLEVPEHDRQHDLRGRQDGLPARLSRRARSTAERLGAGLIGRARLRVGLDQVGRVGSRRAQRQARRHDLGLAVAFAKRPTATVSSSPTKMLGMAKYVAVGLGALLFLFFTIRMLRSRENEAFAGTPTWLRELETPRSLASLEAADTDDDDKPTKIKQLRPPMNVARQQVDELVERDPDRVAAQIRAWMGED